MKSHFAFVATPVTTLRSSCIGDVQARRSLFTTNIGLIRRAYLNVPKYTATPSTNVPNRIQPRATATSGAVQDGGLISIGRGVLMTCGSLALTIGAEQGAGRLLTSLGIQFPGSLAAMLALLSLLTLLRFARLTRIAEFVRGVFMPATKFLTRWLAVFFVPNLVMLPLAPSLPATDVAKIGFIMVFGLLISIISTALIALGLRSLVSYLRGSPAKQAATSVTGGSKPPSGVLIGTLTVLTIGSLPMAISGSIASTLYALSATLLAFCIGQRLPKRIRAVLHPLVVCTAGALGALSLLAQLSGSPLSMVLSSYYARGAVSLGEWGAGNVLAALLGPAVVSFALQMDSRRALVRARAPELLGTAALATTVGLFGTAFAARALSMSPDARLMVVPRMITAPLAAAIVDMLGTQPGVALSVVAVTGLLGANVAMPLLTALRVRDPVVRGLATGAAAHGLGTAAMADEPAAFPFAAIAMTLVGIFATCMVAAPPVRALLLRVALGRILPGPSASA